MNSFLKLSELSLNPANYLVSTDGKPVNHVEFVNQQRAADYIVRLAAATAGKTFKAGKVDNLDAIKASVRAAMADTSHSYVAAPAKPTSAVNDEMVKFALDFVNYETAKEGASKVNEFMQQFNKINDVETVGEYFTEGVVKLNKIYSISEILSAVQSTIELLG
jgi:hypothetical protein